MRLSLRLSPLERGFERDLADVRAMIDGGLVNPDRLRELVAEIEDELFRLPVVDVPALREKVASLR